MQVITGKYRARKLESLDTNLTRPTLARVKESVFSMIDPLIANSVVLDLFAGSGSMGIECISRGASEVVFVDNNAQAEVVLKKNLKNVVEPYEIHISDYENYLKTTSKQFDIVFLDPPYKSDFGVKAIKILAERQLLKKNAIIILEEDAKNCLQIAPEMFIIQKSRAYGTANITILKYAEE